MKRIAVLLLALLLLTVVGCTQTKQQSEPVVEKPEEEPAVETVVEPVYVYEKAEKNYLEPVLDFSWEREHAPEIVMVHFTSAVVNHRDDPYNPDHVRQIFIDYDLSIHYVILRDGTIQCYIPEDRVAWHAGKGEYNNDPRYTNAMNHYAIGIEILAMGSESDMSIYLTPGEYRALDDSLKGYTDAQYEALRGLVADICQRNNIPMDRQHVIGHEDYSPGKTDPGELFDWDRLLGEMTT